MKICSSYVTCYGKRDHIPHFIKIEITPLLNCAFNADYNGTFGLAMRCSDIKRNRDAIIKALFREYCVSMQHTMLNVQFRILHATQCMQHAHTRAVSARFHTTRSFSLLFSLSVFRLNVVQLLWKVIQLSCAL